MSRSLIILTVVAVLAIIGLFLSDALVSGAYTTYKFSPSKIRDVQQFKAKPQESSASLYAPRSAGKKPEIKKNQTSTRAIPAVPARVVNGTVTPATPAAPPTPSSETCIDSDGGKTYTTRGTVTERGREYKDYCRNNYLTEFSCKDGKKASAGVLCMECVEGACTRVA